MHILLAVVSWIAGLTAYLAALRIGWGERISRGDLISVVVFSAVAWAVVYAFVHVPLLHRLRRGVSPVARFISLPLAAVVLGFVAVVVVWLTFAAVAGLFGFGWSFDPSFFTSPEASLFYWFFTASGIVVGVGLALMQPRQAI